MPVEIVNGVQDLNPSWPTAVDPVSEGDDHVRLIKKAIRDSFPGMTAAWNTGSEIKGLGYDAKTGRIRNVGVPVDPTDAARKGEQDALVTRVNNLEAQAAKFASFGVIINTASTPTIAGGSGDFSIAKFGVGNFQITFNEAASATDNQSLVVTATGEGVVVNAITAVIDTQSPTVVSVFTFNSQGNQVNQNFTFQRLAV